ncbi:10140_t:CDS:2 [Entrophospora sp. SA101]|nr:10140_t:CDS:2 [Entrophospora sp. SA101]CAJ0846011.1 13152_t:CDS:2 [Entrophospora sp. SA101]
MLSYITQTFNYIAKAISYLDDSKDPFKTGDLVEVREVIECMNFNAPVFKLPPELINLTDEYNEAQDKLPYTYFEYGDEEYDDADEETKQLYRFGW